MGEDGKGQNVNIWEGKKREGERRKGKVRDGKEWLEMGREEFEIYY